VCHRCAKSNRICLKARTANDKFLIHIENQYASGTVKRPRGPRSTLAPALNVDLQTRALVYYLNYHLQTPPEVQKLLGSVQDCVYEWAVVSKYAIIELAISSMALAVFSRTQRHPPAAAEAGAKYDQLLRSARIVIPETFSRPPQHSEVFGTTTAPPLSCNSGKRATSGGVNP
jgi:hypothetical protein